LISAFAPPPFSPFHSEANIIFSAGKLPYNGDLVEKIMEECATVEEALIIINEYRFNRLQKLGQFMFVDKTGDSIIVGGRAEDNDIDIIRKHKPYQVVTNFFISRPELGGYPCWRYDRAETMLEENDDATIENIRSILDAVHLSENISGTPTLYSYVCDLQNGAIYLYKMHNFQEFILFNLEEELLKGSNTYLINEIFSDIQLVAPTMEESADPSQVTFSWEGKTNSRYRLYCCTDPDFKGCEPIEVENVSSLGASAGPGVGLLFVGFFFIGITAAAGTMKKNLPKFIVLLIILVLVSSCQHNKENEIIPPENEEVGLGEISLTLENLQRGTTYYWKVTANATDNFTSETIVRTFTTTN
jgi:hypothetical protein